MINPAWSRLSFMIIISEIIRQICRDIKTLFTQVMHLAYIGEHFIVEEREIWTKDYISLLSRFYYYYYYYYYYFYTIMIIIIIIIIH